MTCYFMDRTAPQASVRTRRLHSRDPRTARRNAMRAPAAGLIRWCPLRRSAQRHADQGIDRGRQQPRRYDDLTTPLTGPNDGRDIVLAVGSTLIELISHGSLPALAWRCIHISSSAGNKTRHQGLMQGPSSRRAQSITLERTSEVCGPAGHEPPTRGVVDTCRRAAAQYRPGGPAAGGWWYVKLAWHRRPADRLQVQFAQLDGAIGDQELVCR